MMRHDDAYSVSDAPAPMPTLFVFAGYAYYPEGGVKDFRSAHHDLDSAETVVRAGRTWDSSRPG